jgi:hypothetical protein
MEGITPVPTLGEGPNEASVGGIEGSKAKPEDPVSTQDNNGGEFRPHRNRHSANSLTNLSRELARHNRAIPVAQSGPSPDAPVTE